MVDGHILIYLHAACPFRYLDRDVAMLLSTPERAAKRKRCLLANLFRVEVSIRNYTLILYQEV